MIDRRISHLGATDLEESRKDLGQLRSQIDGLTASLSTSTTETTTRIEDRIQTSTTSLEGSIREEIQRTVSSIPRESNISRASLETLSALVFEMVASRIESRTFQDSSKISRRLASTHSNSLRKSAHGSQTASASYKTAFSQTTVDDSLIEGLDSPLREKTSSRLFSTSVQTFISFFGTVVIRRFNFGTTLLGLDRESVSGRARAEVDFVPANWLRSWTGCGIFLARMGFTKPVVDISFAVARVVDRYSDPYRTTWNAVRNGNADTVKRQLQLKIAYPTDRDVGGQSLLAVSGIKSRQYRTCSLCSMVVSRKEQK